MSILTKEQIDEAMIYADQLAKNNSWFSLSWIISKITGSDTDQTKALNLYKKSYDDYLLIHDYESSAYVALKVASLSKIFNYETEEVYDWYQKCAINFKKINQCERSVKVCNSLIAELENECRKNNKFKKLAVNIGAECLEDMGKIYEENQKYKESIKSYTDASDICEDAKSIELLCKVADIHISKNNNIESAKDIYLKILSKLKKDDFSAVLSIDYIFMLLLCEFNLHVKKNAVFSLEEKVKLYPVFKNSNEYHLLNNCINAYKESDTNEFTKVVNSYDAIYKLNPVKMRLLDDIRRVSDCKKYIGTAIY